MQKNLRRLAAVLLLLATAPAHAAGIAATVNDDVITVSDVKNRVQLYMLGTPTAPPAEALRQMETQTLDRLIDEKLQMQEAHTLGIVVDQGQLQEAFAQIARQNGLEADEFRQRLSSAGVRAETLQDQIHAELAWAQVVRRRLRPQINVSEGEIDNAMEQMTRDLQKPQYRVAEIFLNVPGEAHDADVRQKAQDIVQKITKGAAFSGVAREFSEAPGAALGGDLGWIQDGQLDPLLDAALEKMKAGQISPPIRTEKGYHVLFLRDLRQPGMAGAPVTAPASSTAAPAGGPVVHIKQILIPIAPGDPEPVVNAKIVRAQSLKAEISGCAQMDEKAKDFASPSTGDLGKGPLDALPPPVRAVVESLPVGELSGPVRSDAGVAVLMVCGREEGKPPEESAKTQEPAFVGAPDKGDETAREDIANKIGMKRLDQMQERYLRDLRATAFIEKRL